MQPVEPPPIPNPPPRVDGAQALAELGMSLAILIRVIAGKLMNGDWQQTRPQPPPPPPAVPGAHPPQGQAPEQPTQQPAQPPAGPTPAKNPKAADWLEPAPLNPRHAAAS